MLGDSEFKVEMPSCEGALLRASVTPFGTRATKVPDRLDALERALYVFMRIPQCDGSAMRATGWVLGFCELTQ